jgi:hypothetical protein
MLLTKLLPAFVLPLQLALANQQAQAPVSVHLFPSPQSSSNSIHKVPTLTPAEGKAVIAHHLGTADQFEELPNGHADGAWAHLVSLMEGKDPKSKSRVVIIEGDVLPEGKLWMGSGEFFIAALYANVYDRCPTPLYLSTYLLSPRHHGDRVLAFPVCSPSTSVLARRYRCSPTTSKDV